MQYLGMMRVLIKYYMLVVVLSTSTMALSSRTVVCRREALMAAAVGVSFPTASLAVATTTSSKSDATAFVGTFTDPINHPGCTRTIQLVGEAVGDYQLAQVVGGGGRGEPQSFVLPAAILGRCAIVIDFSPKGGPRDFTGVLQPNGNVKFLRDGNVWPRQASE